MYHGLYLLLALVAITNGNGVTSGQDLKEKINGGANALLANFPYQVSVRYRGSHDCGGVILSPRVVISAAHCFCGKHSHYSIQYGSTDVDGGKNVKIARIDFHDLFAYFDKDNDVAIIHLAEDIEFGPNARPIALASQSPAAGKNAVVSGWSRPAEGYSPRTLQEIKVQIVDHSVCIMQYAIKREVTDSMLCAGVNGSGKDISDGHFGGPLVVNNELVGIASWRLESKNPGVYADVAYLREWIVKQINSD